MSWIDPDELLELGDDDYELLLDQLLNALDPPRPEVLVTSPTIDTLLGTGARNLFRWLPSQQ